MENNRGKQIEKAAFDKHEELSKLKPKYQVPDDFWMDWFRLGAEWADEHRSEKTPPLDAPES